MAGVATSGVILSTYTQAADEDYRITILSDACADPIASLHEELMTNLFPRSATVLTVDQWIGGGQPLTLQACPSGFAGWAFEFVFSARARKYTRSDQAERLPWAHINRLQRFQQSPLLFCVSINLGNLLSLKANPNRPKNIRYWHSSGTAARLLL